MENNVVTLETAKKLKWAGFPQKSFGCAYTGPLDDDGKEYDLGYGGITVFDFAAPTAQAIADQLSLDFPSAGLMIITLNPTTWRVSSVHDTRADGPTMAEALALLWLKLKGGADDAV